MGCVASDVCEAEEEKEEQSMKRRNRRRRRGDREEGRAIAMGEGALWDYLEE